MEARSDRVLLRQVEATMVPSGDKINLQEGMLVTITHRLGGNFTVTCDYGMFRILGRDADALGEQMPEEVVKVGLNGSQVFGRPSDEVVWEQLKQVFDPEIPVNIVDLGLVYNMQIVEIEPENYTVEMSMTLTAPGCGMGPAIAEDAKNRILSIGGIKDAKVELVWDPPWNQDMISEAGKMQLGLI